MKKTLKKLKISKKEIKELVPEKKEPFEVTIQMVNEGVHEFICEQLEEFAGNLILHNASPLAIKFPKKVIRDVKLETVVFNKEHVLMYATKEKGEYEYE